MSDEQRCGTCAHWRTVTFVAINGARTESGPLCLYPIPEWAYGSNETLENHGRFCDTWEAKR